MAGMLPRLFGENMFDVMNPFTDEDFYMNEPKRDPLFGRHANRVMRICGKSICRALPRRK